MSTRVSKIKARRSAIAIRKSRPNEMVYRTGEVEHRNCLCVHEKIHSDGVLQLRYRALNEPARRAMVDWSSGVLFHEMVAESGERFAYPQVLSEEKSISPAWRATEKALFQEPLYLWVYIAEKKRRGRYQVGTHYAMEARPVHNPLFREQLNEALKPDLIETLDHPVVRRLQTIFGDLEENVPEEWVCVE